MDAKAILKYNKNKLYLYCKFKLIKNMETLTEKIITFVQSHKILASVVYLTFLLALIIAMSHDGTSDERWLRLPTLF